MLRKSLLILAAIALVATSGIADDNTRWINVHVTEADSNTNVEVHLPLNLVITVLESVNVEGFEGGKIDLEMHDAEIDWPAIFQAITDAPDGEFVTVRSDEADVDVTKRSGMVYINVNEKENDNVEAVVTVPVSLVNALNFDGDNRIDVRALLASLEELPNGELVKVTSDEATVRVWVE